MPNRVPARSKVTRSSPGATVRDSSVPKASNRWILRYSRCGSQFGPRTITVLWTRPSSVGVNEPATTTTPCSSASSWTSWAKSSWCARAAARRSVPKGVRVASGSSTRCAPSPAASPTAARTVSKVLATSSEICSWARAMRGTAARRTCARVLERGERLAQPAQRPGGAEELEVAVLRLEGGDGSAPGAGGGERGEGLRAQHRHVPAEHQHDRLVGALGELGDAAREGGQRP